MCSLQLLLLALTLAWGSTVVASSASIVVQIDITKIVNEVDDRFLSVGLGTRLVNMPKWNGFNTKSQKLINMVKELSPGYLRVGGTSADEAVFVEKPNRYLGVQPRTNLKWVKAAKPPIEPLW